MCGVFDVACAFQKECEQSMFTTLAGSSGKGKVLFHCRPKVYDPDLTGIDFK